MDKKVATSRSANFSPEEIEIILDTLTEFPELVAGTFSARFPTKEKLTEQWRILTKKLTSTNMGVERTVTQVRNKWQDLKYRVKQKHVKHKQHMSVTGGGPGDKTPYTKTELRIIGLVGVRCIEGVTDNSCDTTTRTLQNLKKKNVACDLPTSDADRSKINAENSEYMTFGSVTQNSMVDVLVATPVADQVTFGSVTQNSMVDVLVATPVADQVTFGSVTQNSMVDVLVATPVADQVTFGSETQNSMVDVLVATPVADQVTFGSETQNSMVDVLVATPVVDQVTFGSETQNSMVDVLVATPVADQENEEMTTPLRTPKTSWPIRKSSNSSTQRGQRHRDRKRKKRVSELEDFETAALETQRNMCQQVTSLAASMAEVAPAVSAQQDTLNNINNNLIALLGKIDKTNTLLQIALNVDEELAKD